MFWINQFPEGREQVLIFFLQIECLTTALLSVWVICCCVAPTPKLAGSKRKTPYDHFSCFCGLAGAKLHGSSTGLTWSFSCSCIHVLVMAGHLRWLLHSCLVPHCSSSGFFLQQGGMVYTLKGRQVRFPRGGSQICQSF